MDLARLAFEALGDQTDKILLIGRARAVERERLAENLAPFRTGAPRERTRTDLFVVATQCLEVGVDVDSRRPRHPGRTPRRPPPAFRPPEPRRPSRPRRKRNPRGGRRCRGRSRRSGLRRPYPTHLGRTRDASRRIASSTSAPTRSSAHSPSYRPTRSPRCDPTPRSSCPRTLTCGRRPRQATACRSGCRTVSARHRADVRTGVSIVWRADLLPADLDEPAPDGPAERLRLVPPLTAEAIEVPLWSARAWLQGSGPGLDEDE